MREALKRRLKECGFDVEVMATSPVIAQLPRVSRAVYVCKDKNGAILVTGVPETAWHFEGSVYLVDQVMLLVDKAVVSEWPPFDYSLSK